MNRATWLQDRRMLKFRDVLSRWERRDLSMLEAGELLGMSERQFRRYRDRYEEEGEAGLLDRRLGKPSTRSASPAEAIEADAAALPDGYRGWNVRHFHEHLRARPQFRLGLHLDQDATARGRAGGAGQAAWRASAQAREEAVRGHDAAPGRLAAQLACEQAAARPDRDHGRCHQHDLLGVSGRGGRHGFELCGLLEVFAGRACRARSTPIAAVTTSTPKAGEAVDKDRLTQVGRALDRLGIEHIPAYSPEARGRSERMFSTLQDRLPKELALAGIADIEAANRFFARPICRRTMPALPSRPPLPRSAFVAADPALLAEILCIEEERVVARDNTVAFGASNCNCRRARTGTTTSRQASGSGNTQTVARRLPRPPPYRKIPRRRLADRPRNQHQTGSVNRFDAKSEADI